DNDRTRRSRLLVRLAGCRNLVQLGRFVVPGLTLTDRARVLAAYAAGRGLSRRAQRRLARWLIAKTMARRCAIDRIPEAAAPRAPGARRRGPLRLHAVELPVLSPRRVARARAAGGARLLELRRRRRLPQAPSPPRAARDRALGRLARARAPGARRVRARDAGP